jgi:hypothetical protein
MRYLSDAADLWLAGAPRHRGALAGPPPNQPPVTAADAATVFAETPTVIDVLANDSDPEGGVLSLLSAVAEFGTAEIRPDGTLLYTSALGFTGTDTVAYVAADPLQAEAPGLLAVTVAGPLLAVDPMTDGTLVVQAASGEISLTVTSPPDFAGTYVTDTALLASGPVNLAPPVVEGAAQQGALLTARDGLWIHGGEVTGETWTWRRNGIEIPGAIGPSYMVVSGDLGTVLSAVQTLTAEGGSRDAASAPFAITQFSPADDPALVAWFDASAAASVAATGSSVTSWANLAGAGSLSATSGPQTGTRAIAGRNVIDFSGGARMTGAVTIPADGNVAIHAVLAIDAVVSAFAAPLSMRSVSAADFQLDANSSTQFAGRMNVSGIGTSYALQGGPFSGVVLVSILFDRTGTASTEVFVNGVSAGSGTYTVPLDGAQTLGLMTNRTQNAFFDGAVAEVVVTGALDRADAYRSYLTDKWGIT